MLAPITAVICALALAAAGWLWHLRRNRVLVSVDGSSMEPTYSDGDRLLLRRTRTASVHKGQIIAVAPEHVTDSDSPQIIPAETVAEGSLWYIKRVAAAPGDPVPTGVGALSDKVGELVPSGSLIILGDNPAESHDSREEGFVDAHRLRGIVIRRFDS